MLSRPALFAPFATSGFPGLWVSASSGSFARVTIQLAFSWITLEATGSPFWVGVISAARMLPQFIFGIPAGATADWVDRRLMVMAVNGASVVLLLALVGLALAGALTPAILVGITFLVGTLDTMRTASTQSYAYDLVRTTRATSGMALMNLGTQSLGTIGGLVGGYILEQYGSVATFGVIAAAFLLATVAPAIGARPKIEGPIAAPTSDGAAVATSARPDNGRKSRRARPDFAGAALMLVHNPVLATLAIGIMLAEVLGFATQTLLPTFARDVFDVGASGLGTMLALRSGGGALGLLLLATVGAEGRSGLVFVTGATLFGVMLLLFAQMPVYGLALVLLAFSGTCAGIMDTLGQTLMQRNAGEQRRGAAMGLWVFSIGFAPVGSLSLGASATAYGAPLTMGVSGALLTMVGLTLAMNRRLRTAR